MKEIRHDLNEAAQMLTGATWWLSQKNTKQARECIDKGKELLEKADAELRTEELIEEVEVMEEMQSDPESTGLLKIKSLLDKCDELKEEAEGFSGKPFNWAEEQNDIDYSQMDAKKERQEREYGT